MNKILIRLLIFCPACVHRSPCFGAPLLLVLSAFKDYCCSVRSALPCMAITFERLFALYFSEHPMHLSHNYLTVILLFYSLNTPMSRYHTCLSELLLFTLLSTTLYHYNNKSTFFVLIFSYTMVIAVNFIQYSHASPQKLCIRFISVYFIQHSPASL